MSEVWGPIYWMYLHMITKQYPDKPALKDKTNYFNLVKSFISTIPCSSCNEHTQKIVNDEDLKTSLDKKEDFEKYIWNLHNQVNRKLNKKTLDITHFHKIYNRILNKTYNSNLIKLIKFNRLKNYVIIILFIGVIITKIVLLHVILKTKFKFKRFEFLNKLIIQLFHNK